MGRASASAVAAVLVAAVFALGAAQGGLGFGGARAGDLVPPAVTAVTGLVTIAACVLTARRLGTPAARGWWWLAAAGAVWTAGAVAAVVLESTGRTAPTAALHPSVLAAPLATAAFLAFVPTRGQLTARTRVVVDGAIFAAGLFFVAWALVVGGWGHYSSGGVAEHVAPAAGMAAAVVALTTAVFVRGQLPAPAAGVVGMASTGLALLVASAGAVVHRELSGSAPGPVAWWLQAAGLAVLGAAAALAARRRATVTVEVLPPAPSHWTLLAHGAVLVAVFVAAAEQLVEGALEPVLFWAVAAVVVLLLVRQGVFVREVVNLSRGLEVAVQDRTAELRASERRFRSLVEHSSEVVSIVGPDTLRVEYVSESLARIFGHSAAQALGRSLTEGVHADDRAHLLALARDVAAEPGAVATVRFRFRHGDGSWRHVTSTVRNLVDEPSVGGLVLNVRDITEHIRLEDQLSHQAFHDALTGLPNRALFTDRLDHAIARAGRSASPVVVLYLDLDGFKNVNDTFGHECGDQLISAVADRLERSLRSADTVARFGGDEFAVLLADGPADSNPGAQVAERILRLFETPFLVDDLELAVGASIGIAEAVTGFEDAGDLLRNADVAMYMAKNRGRNRYERFDPSVHADVSERTTLESELRQALDRGQLFLDYQPIVDIASGEIEGVEALVRWRHPHRGLVSPGQFIPLAEETGLIEPIGAWVLVEACRHMRSLQREFPEHSGLTVSVNLSAWQVRQPGVVEQVAGVLAETGLEPSSLTLEITESVLMEDVEEIVTRLSALKELGVNLAIDDFGTGYSSLAYLRRFPIDTLKVDQSFVQGVGLGPEESALARAIIKLGRTFRLKTVAEGIESPEQAEALREMGCDSAQGYYFFPPLDLPELRSVLGRSRPAGAVPAGVRGAVWG